MSEPQDPIKIKTSLPALFGLTIKKGIELFANLIAERIIEDRKNGDPLYNRIKIEYARKLKNLPDEFKKTK